MTLDPRNPFAARSTLPFELPDFAHIRSEHYLPAFEQGMAEQAAELAAIAADPAPPTRENVIDAWEVSGQLLRRVELVFVTVKSADTTPELDRIEEEIAPKLAAHQDAIYLDRGLYDRVRALAGRVDSGEVVLDGQAAYWLERTTRAFERAGVGLGVGEQARLRELNVRIAELKSRFGRLCLEGRNAAAVWVTDVAELAGLTDGEIEAARQRAVGRGRGDAWLLELTNTSGQPMLAVLRDRGLRERIHRASVGRGLGGEYDTRGVVVDLVRARAERAELLGFATHAEYVTSWGCAGSAEAVADRLGGMVPAVAKNVAAETAELSAESQRSIKPWDWLYLAEILRAKRYQLDESALKPYLEINRVLTHGVFAAATALYGITFIRRPDLAGYNADVQVWEVRDSDGSPLGLFLADYFTRPGKQGGAWMNSQVEQNHLLGQLPVVCNNLNLVRPPAGQPALITWDNVTTMFHEFGHALHGLFSDVRYVSQSGTSVPRDFVEFPSQVNEIWALNPALLADFAVHHETGEPMPQELQDALRGSQLFQQGYSTAEYLAAALLDQAWHTTPLAELPTGPEGVEAFEAAALEKAGLAFDLIPPRYRTTYFSHVFENDYDAGYYAYIWSEVLDADAAAWMQENGGLTRENGERFRRRLLARGGSADAMALYRDYRGQEPDISHLLQRRGLAPAKAGGDDVCAT